MKKWSVFIFISLLIISSILIIYMNFFLDKKQVKNNVYETYTVSKSPDIIVTAKVKPVYTKIYKDIPIDEIMKKFHDKKILHVNKNEILFNANNSKVKAPFAGEIEFINNDNTSENTVSLVSKEKVLITHISEFDLANIYRNQKVKLLSTNDKQMTGVINYISNSPVTSSSDNVIISSLYQVDISVPQKNLKIGKTFEVRIPTDKVNIPKESMIDGKIYLYNSKDKKVYLKDIKYEINNNNLEVLKGLNLRDKIISNPDDHLFDGKKIEVN